MRTAPPARRCCAYPAATAPPVRMPANGSSGRRSARSAGRRGPQRKPRVDVLVRDGTAAQPPSPTLPGARNGRALESAQKCTFARSCFAEVAVDLFRHPHKGRVRRSRAGGLLPFHKITHPQKRAGISRTRGSDPFKFKRTRESRGVSTRARKRRTGKHIFRMSATVSPRARGSDTSPPATRDDSLHRPAPALPPRHRSVPSGPGAAAPRCCASSCIR